MIVSRKTHAVSYLHGFIRCFSDYYFKKSVLNLTIAIYFCTFAIAIRPVGRFVHLTSLVKQSIRYYFAFSQKPRKLVGNNVTEIIVIRYSVWSALVYYVIEMHLAIGVVYSLLVD